MRLTDLFLLFLGMGVQGAVVIATVLVLRALLKKIHVPSRVFLWLWAIVFFYLICPWKVELPGGFWASREETQSRISAIFAPEEPTQSAQVQNGLTQNGQTQSGLTQNGQAAQDGLTQNGQMQGGLAQNGQTQDGQTQNGQTQNGLTQNGQTAQDGLTQNGQTQDGQAQNGQAQDGLTQNGQAAQDGLTQNGQAQDGQAQNGQMQDGQQAGVPGSLPDRASASRTFPVLKVLAALWLGGVLLLFGNLFFTYWRMKRKLAENLTDTAQGGRELHWVESIETPMVFGLFRPGIYLPLGLGGNNLEYVLLHESCHIRRGDFLWKMLTYGIAILHWYNPLVWLAYKLFSDDLEKACDEQVLGLLGEQRKRDYAYALLEAAGADENKSRMRFTAPICFNEGNVRKRIESLMQYRAAKPAVIAGTALLCLAVAVLFGTSTMAKEEPESQKTQEDIRQEESRAGERQPEEGLSGEGSSGKGQAGEGQSEEGQSGEEQSGKEQAGEGQSGEGESEKGLSEKTPSGTGQSGEGASGTDQSETAQSGNDRTGKGQSEEGQSGKQPSGEGKEETSPAQNGMQAGAEEAQVLYRLTMTADGTSYQIEALGERQEQQGIGHVNRIRELRVSDAGGVIQTLSLSRAITEANGFHELYQDSTWTQSSFGDGMELVDINRDGYQDVKILEMVGNAYVPYLIFCWEPGTKQLKYRYTLYWPQTDEEGRLTEEYREDQGVYVRNIFRTDEKHRLVMIGSKLEFADTKEIREQREHYLASAAYNRLLWNLIYNRKWICWEGEEPFDYDGHLTCDRYALLDVDGDRREELVVLNGYGQRETLRVRLFAYNEKKDMVVRCQKDPAEVFADGQCIWEEGNNGGYQVHVYNAQDQVFLLRYEVTYQDGRYELTDCADGESEILTDREFQKWYAERFGEEETKLRSMIFLPPAAPYQRLWAW